MVNYAVVAISMIVLAAGLGLIASLPDFFSSVHKTLFALLLFGVTGFILIKSGD